MDEVKENKLHKKMDHLFLTSLNKKVFSGASLAYSFVKNKELQKTVLHYGKTDYKDTSLYVDDVTFFDLASLTKPLVTTLSLLVLLSEGTIRLEDKLSSLLSVLVPLDKKKITLFHLMSHSSGLPAHKPYYQRLLDYPLERRREKVLQWILEEKLLYQPGSKHQYSDLDFLLLGSILEEKTGKNIENYWCEKIILPLELESYFCFSGITASKNRKFAATGSCPWSRKELNGTVHDDNCRAMGGMAGHAGLFGRAEGVVSLCEHLFMQYKDAASHPSYANSWLRTILTKQGGSTWTMGFDTPSQPCSSSGRYFSEKSVGHLGFTGTSFWIDLEKGITVVLLTNRVLLKDEKREIQSFRPQVHDSIMEEILELK